MPRALRIVFGENRLVRKTLAQRGFLHVLLRQSRSQREQVLAGGGVDGQKALLLSAGDIPFVTHIERGEKRVAQSVVANTVVVLDGDDHQYLVQSRRRPATDSVCVFELGVLPRVIAAEVDMRRGQPILRPVHHALAVVDIEQHIFLLLGDFPDGVDTVAIQRLGQLIRHNQRPIFLTRQIALQACCRVLQIVACYQKKGKKQRKSI